MPAMLRRLIVVVNQQIDKLMLEPWYKRAYYLCTTPPTASVVGCKARFGGPLLFLGVE